MLASCVTSKIGTYWEDPPIETPTFELPDADSGDDDSGDAGEVMMCAVTTCSLPWATCDASRFPCDVNLQNDNENCGTCGNRCKGPSAGNSTWTCFEGDCAFSCTGIGFRNCDGDTENGCETSVRYDPKNCGACGRECPAGQECTEGTCYDPCIVANRPDTCNGECTNLKTDSSNCGTCGNKCDPKDPTKPALPSDMHYGCSQGTCGNAQCNSSTKRDCNNDVSDGCEVTLHTNDHCNDCNDKCPAGKTCMYNGVYYCGCADGETNCGVEGCKQLDDDPLHCGGCNRVCPGNGRPHFTPSCSLGVCGGACAEHYADCDGIVSNGCEVNTRVDNTNCGACGNACAKDQVCSEGRCLVTPCDAGPGPIAK
ncbi:hypothetical protein AKJ09_10604 [Labilithrix luteola]|uniref:Tryptophan synthase alpha chain n=1 Tax=Labilithrix luteola TaxID=1391654 RepID=A0A0K1QDU1_9BACT|nr:hypothetical protein AKJ09_10604 [Labilithrix luteola]